MPETQILNITATKLAELLRLPEGTRIADLWTTDYETGVAVVYTSQTGI
jgi:hypothetical protein